jgi:oligo-1,6-glucosidase
MNREGEPMGRRWWHDAVIYHIYPRSFHDADGDGIGDLEGIIEKLTYLRDLGISAIWMGPVFRSPQVDNGYDVSDYRSVDPIFGSDETIDRLIARAHSYGIRVLLDLVFNHTSDRHEWFVASAARRDEYDDFYIWRDPAPDGGPPNDWRSVFSVPAWTWNEERGQYYLHLFAPEQPDLNWDNARVRSELAAVARYWLDRGVDGFRLDVINFISKMPDLPSLDGASPRGVFIDGPNVERYLQEFRGAAAIDRDTLLVGETPGLSDEAARRYTDPTSGPLDMVLHFDHVELDHGPGGRWDPRPWRVAEMRAVLAHQQTLFADSWPSIYLSNHDQPRVVSRYGDDGEFRHESATALATAFFLLRGTPIVYQGDEIPMRNMPIDRVERIVDIETGNAYADLVAHGVPSEDALRRVASSARDNARTPMQWNARDEVGGFVSPDAGSGVTPWYPLNPDFRRWNVESRYDTTVGCFRDLFQLRAEIRALRAGRVEMAKLDEESSLIAYRRVDDDDAIAVLVNLSGEIVEGAFPHGDPDRRLLGNYPDSAPYLRPWEALVYRTGDAGP